MKNIGKGTISLDHMLKMMKISIFQVMVPTGQRNSTLNMPKKHIIDTHKLNGQEPEEDNVLNRK